VYVSDEILREMHTKIVDRILEGLTIVEMGKLYYNVSQRNGARKCGLDSVASCSCSSKVLDFMIRLTVSVSQKYISFVE
jgi:hypothetical protein